MEKFIIEVGISPPLYSYKATYTGVDVTFCQLSQVLTPPCVLGAGVSGTVSSANLDNMKTTGNYAVAGDGWGLLTVEAFNASYIKQIRYYAVDHKTEVRYCTNGTWGNWCNMDAFGCNTAADLASLLGASCGNLPVNADLNNYIQSGMYVTNSINGNSIANVPSELENTSASFTLIVQNISSASASQIIICTDSWGIYTRLRFSSGSWGNWITQRAHT